MPDGLYERDALAWAEHQADLLSRHAAGERLNEAIDWTNVIEEVRDVGLSELRACESLLTQALMHLLKLRVWPESPAASHWRQETAAFLAGARRNYTPSMRQRISVIGLYADASHAMLAGGDVQQESLPGVCLLGLDDLIALHPDVADLVARL